MRPPAAKIEGDNCSVTENESLMVQYLNTLLGWAGFRALALGKRVSYDFY
jgi:hypothetical protein